jgi:hypothetical protein
MLEAEVAKKKKKSLKKREKNQASPREFCKTRLNSQTHNPLNSQSQLNT